MVQNLAQLGLPGALTGPVERGDVSSVERHLRTLEARAPELLALYRLVGRDVLRLAREKSALDPGQRGPPRRAVLRSAAAGTASADGGRKPAGRAGFRVAGCARLWCDVVSANWPGSWPNIGPVSTLR